MPSMKPSAQAPRTMTYQLTSRIPSNLSELTGTVAPRFFDSIRANNPVAIMVDATIHTSRDRPTISSILIDLRAKNPWSSQ
jgi:hypothetical protein